MTLKETVDFIVKEANNSRFPVYEEDIDNIVGVLHMRDVLYFAEQEEYLDRPISQIDGLLRSAHFAPMPYLRRCSRRRSIWRSSSTNTARQPGS